MNNFKSKMWKQYLKDLRASKSGVYDRILKSQEPEFYNFLLSEYSQFKFFGEKVYHYLNGSNKRPLCRCGKEILSFREQKYAKHCSKKCSKNDPKTQIIFEQTCLKRYGVKHNMQVESVKEKYRKSHLLKYGVESPFINENFKRKIHQTKIENGSHIKHTNEYKVYALKVKHFTNKQNTKCLENYSLRGRTKKHYHLDHKYSVLKGYLDNIEPEIIGSIVNLEFIPASINCSKQEKCSISKEELLKLYSNL